MLTRINVRSSVQIIDSAGEKKTVPNILLNFGEDVCFENLRSQLEVSLKLRPTDPDLSIQKLELSLGKGQKFEEVLSEKQFAALQEKVIGSSKILLKVYATAKWNPVQVQGTNENLANTSSAPALPRPPSPGKNDVTRYC